MIGALDGFTNTSGDFTLADTTDLTVTGTIDVTGHTLTLDNQDGINASGAVIKATTLTGSANVADFSNASNVVANLGTFLTSENFTLADSTDLTVVGDNIYANSYAFTLVSTGTIYVNANIQNSGGGDVTLIAGWDGTTSLASILATPTAYGNGGSVTIGNPAMTSSVAVGSNGGTTTVVGYDVNVHAGNADPSYYAQIGYHGIAGGDINVVAVHNVEFAPGTSDAGAQIGNGGADITGDVTGNISVLAPNVLKDEDTGGGGLEFWIGNYTSSGIESGNLSLTAGTVDGPPPLPDAVRNGDCRALGTSLRGKRRGCNDCIHGRGSELLERLPLRQPTCVQRARYRLDYLQQLYPEFRERRGQCRRRLGRHNL